MIESCACDLRVCKLVSLSSSISIVIANQGSYTICISFDFL